MICAWIDVERRHGLVGSDEVGVQRQRPREADALPLAAGELVRVPRARVRRRPTISSSSRTRASALVAREPVVGAAARHDAADAVARVQRRIRVLEDHLHAPAERASSPLQGASSWPSKRCGRPSARTAAGSRARGRLAAADSPTRPSVSPRSIVNETSSTALMSPMCRSRTTPLLIGNQTSSRPRRAGRGHAVATLRPGRG